MFQCTARMRSGSTGGPGGVSGVNQRMVSSSRSILSRSAGHEGAARKTSTVEKGRSKRWISLHSGMRERSGVM